MKSSPVGRNITRASPAGSVSSAQRPDFAPLHAWTVWTMSARMQLRVASLTVLTEHAR